jgi:DNA invertase Pin-like site-specific DNA recombinase
MTTSRAVAYLRVSTDGQTESGLGLAAQQSAIAAAAARHGLTVTETFIDAGVSGALELKDRPGLFAAVEALKRGDTLIIAKRDRLGRDVVAVAMIERLIERKGCRVLSAAGEGTEANDPSAILQRRILDAFAEYERLIIGARTKAALKAKRQRGERAGNVPYGFTLADDGRTLIEQPAERQTLDTIRQLRASGASLRAVAETLNARGSTTRSGAAWRFEYVRSLTAAA